MLCTWNAWKQENGNFNWKILTFDVEWNTALAVVDIWRKPKLRTYCVIKTSYSVESYVKYNLTKRQRSLCAQLRSGTLPIALEIGRLNATPEEDRNCLFCDID